MIYNSAWVYGHSFVRPSPECYDKTETVNSTLPVSVMSRGSAHHVDHVDHSNRTPTHEKSDHNGHQTLRHFRFLDVRPQPVHIILLREDPVRSRYLLEYFCITYCDDSEWTKNNEEVEEYGVSDVSLEIVQAHHFARVELKSTGSEKMGWRGDRESSNPCCCNERSCSTSCEDGLEPIWTNNGEIATDGSKAHGVNRRSGNSENTKSMEPTNGCAVGPFSSGKSGSRQGHEGNGHEKIARCQCSGADIGHSS